MSPRVSSDHPPSTAETLPATQTKTGHSIDSDASETFTTDFGFLPIPSRVRYDPQHPAHFGLLMNVIFGIASTFIVANLYYCQPLLIQFSISFGVSYHEVSNIPTLVQAGYATGLLFITPLGDLVRRRPLLLLLTFFTATLTIGLAITSNLVAFEVLSFFVGVGTVTPQILMPLAVDLAPPERRASALSIVLSGLLFGVLVARVLAGVVAQFVTWRVVFYLAIGLQYGILAILYWMLPDYPAKNKGATYFGILSSMAKFTVTEPVLIQAILITIPSSACFTNWWVTLTFLLGGPPYNYSTVVIGLFGLVGMVGVASAPLIGRTIDKLVPWSATLVAIIALTVTFTIQTAAVGLHVVVVVIVTIGLDVFRQTQQVSLTTAVLSLDASARSRLNACLILSLFIGQVMGTSVGSKVFTSHGWRPDAALNLGWTVWGLFVLLMRGPHCKRYTWFGWEGGLELRKSKVNENQERQEALEAAKAEKQRDGAEDEGEIVEVPRGKEGMKEGSEVMRMSGESLTKGAGDAV